MALVVTLFSLLKKSKIVGSQKYIAFIALWLSWEWCQLHWDLSWPWLTLGNVFSNFPSLVQWYEFTGVFGGSLWILIINVLLLKVILKIVEKQYNRSLYALITLAVCTIVLPIVISTFTIEKEKNLNNLVNCLIIQQNSTPSRAKDKEYSKIIDQRLISMVNQNIDSNTQLVVMPESAILQEINEDSILNNKVIDHFITLQKQYPKATFMMGATTFTNQDNQKKTYNSALFVGETGKIEIYHKSKLVPGVEEYPFKKVTVPSMKWIKGNSFDEKFTSGNHQKCFTVDSKQSKTGVAICYESVYGAYISQLTQNGANFITLITNDGWWDNTDGYKQHLAISQLRAIENRCHILRVANTGISAIITPAGITTYKTEWNEQTVIRSSVKMNTKKTFYVIHGDFILTIANLITLLFIMLYFSNLLQQKKR